MEPAYMNIHVTFTHGTIPTMNIKLKKITATGHNWLFERYSSNNNNNNNSNNNSSGKNEIDVNLNDRPVRHKRFK